MRIAVAMATFNGSRWVGDQLAGILAQTRRPDQIVAADDGSGDGTDELVRRSLSSAGIPFRLLTGGRHGITGNFERALRAVDADVVALADQDDIWYPAKLETIEAALADGAVTGVFSDADVVDGSGTPTGRSLWGLVGFRGRLRRDFETDPLHALLRQDAVTGATLAFRTSVLRWILPLPREGWHDRSIALALASTGRLRALDEKLMAYRLHGANAAGVPPRRRRDRVVPWAERAELIRRHEEQLEDLAARLAGADDHVDRLYAEKLRHLRRRRTLDARLARRAPSVAAELLRGGYRRNAQGLWSAGRDLMG